MNRKVTIVIPCYNATNYISQCISYLQKQTFKNFEVVFVDDCSTDDTLRILQENSCTDELQITVLHNDVNSGPGVSRNKGILHAHTEYITFCDCDDWYEPVFLEKMLGLLESTKSDIAFCGYKVVDEKGNYQSRPVYHRTGSISRSEVFGLDADSLCMLMVKTEIMKSTLLPDLRNGEDVATVPLLMAKSNGYAVTSECLYNYYRRSGSASQRPNMRVVDSLVASYKYVEENFPAGYTSEIEYLGVKNMLYGALISLFAFSFNNKKAVEILDSFEEKHPTWYTNSYLPILSTYKKVVLWCLKHRKFVLLKVIAEIRNKMTR